MHKVFHFKSLPSTQDKAKELYKKGLSNIVVAADFQTKGKGRFNRKWHSGKGDLWLSIPLKLKNKEKPQYLTFIAAISVVESIKKISKLKTSIKWPNDILYNKKKLCGILTKGIFGKDSFVIVGIGLNVNQTKFPNEIRNTATSLRMIKHRFFSIKSLMNEIINNFFFLYHDYYTKNELNHITKLWKKHCGTIGKDIIVVTSTKKIYGKAVGIDNNCSLLLKLKSKRIIRIAEGDIKIRY